MELTSDFHYDGVAIDQEKIIELRPQIEDYAREEHGGFGKSKLYWNRNEDGTFSYQIYFWK